MPHAKAQRTRKVGKIFVSVKCQDLVQRDRHNFASPLRLCVRKIKRRRCKSRPIWQERAISGHFLFMLIGSILSQLNLTQRRRGLAKEVIFWWVRCLALIKCEPAELAEASPSENAEGYSIEPLRPHHSDLWLNPRVRLRELAERSDSAPPRQRQMRLSEYVSACNCDRHTLRALCAFA